MNDYEKMLNMIMNELPVREIPLMQEFEMEGLYRNGVIYLEENLHTQMKKERLAEEYGHHMTTVGNIIDYQKASNRKQEIQARGYGLEILVSLDKLIECADHNLTTSYECAEYLDISEESFLDVILHYFTKYGTEFKYNNKHFTFGEHFVNISE